LRPPAKKLTTWFSWKWGFGQTQAFPFSHEINLSNRSLTWRHNYSTFHDVRQAKKPARTSLKAIERVDDSISSGKLLECWSQKVALPSRYHTWVISCQTYNSTLFPKTVKVQLGYTSKKACRDPIQETMQTLRRRLWENYSSMFPECAPRLESLQPNVLKDCFRPVHSGQIWNRSRKWSGGANTINTCGQISRKVRNRPLFDVVRQTKPRLLYFEHCPGPDSLRPRSPKLPTSILKSSWRSLRPEANSICSETHYYWENNLLPICLPDPRVCEVRFIPTLDWGTGSQIPVYFWLNTTLSRLQQEIRTTKLLRAVQLVKQGQRALQPNWKVFLLSKSDVILSEREAMDIILDLDSVSNPLSQRLYSYRVIEDAPFIDFGIWTLLGRGVLQKQMETIHSR